MTSVPIAHRGDAVDAYTTLTLPVIGRVHCGLRHSVLLLGAGQTSCLTILNAVDAHLGRHPGTGYSNNSLPLQLREALRCWLCRDDVVPAGPTTALHLQELVGRHNEAVHTSAGLRVLRPPLAPVRALDLRRLQQRFNGSAS